MRGAIPLLPKYVFMAQGTHILNCAAYGSLTSAPHSRFTTYGYYTFQKALGWILGPPLRDTEEGTRRHL